MVKESEVFAYLRQKFPKTSEAKMKAGFFFGPQRNNYSTTNTLVQNSTEKEPGRQLKISAETF